MLKVRSVPSSSELLHVDQSVECAESSSLKPLHLPLFRADEWLLGAVDCLEFVPDELVVEVSRGLSVCGDDLPQCKRLLYEVLAQHYGHTQQPPLFSNHVFDIHSGISELLGKTRSCQIFTPVVEAFVTTGSHAAAAFLNLSVFILAFSVHCQ